MEAHIMKYEDVCLEDQIIKDGVFWVPGKIEVMKLPQEAFQFVPVGTWCTGSPRKGTLADARYDICSEVTRNSFQMS
jgi:hypothetical protein